MSEQTNTATQPYLQKHPPVCWLNYSAWSSQSSDTVASSVDDAAQRQDLMWESTASVKINQQRCNCETEASRQQLSCREKKYIVDGATFLFNVFVFIPQVNLIQIRFLLESEFLFKCDACNRFARSYIENMYLTCDELPHLSVHRLPQQTQQGWHASRIPNGHFVFVHGLAIDQVPQSSTGVPLDLQHFVVEEIDQVLDPSQPTHLSAEAH